jgi:hypothetical protein
MSHPFSSLSRRRFEPTVVQQALRTALREARHHGENLLNRGKRHPRAVALTGAAVVLTLGGAYALNAANRSMCPPPGKVTAAAKSEKGKSGSFLLLMDQVPAAKAGSELEIHYDVCGLPSGTAYQGKLRLHQQQRVVKNKKKRGSPQPKPLVLATFNDKTDGLASREQHQVDLRAAKPGTYTLELVVTDNRGRERKKTQKFVVTKP